MNDKNRTMKRNNGLFVVAVHSMFDVHFFMRINP